MRGRFRNIETRKQNKLIADYLKDNDYMVTGGGTYFKEEFLRGNIKGTVKNGNYIDITAKAPDGRTIRINTVDKNLKGEITQRERMAEISINSKIKYDPKLILIRKGLGLDHLEKILKELDLPFGRKGPY